jgi:hypothetical protein
MPQERRSPPCAIPCRPAPCPTPRTNRTDLVWLTNTTTHRHVGTSRHLFADSPTPGPRTPPVPLRTDRGPRDPVCRGAREQAPQGVPRSCRSCLLLHLTIVLALSRDSKCAPDVIRGHGLGRSATRSTDAIPGCASRRAGDKVRQSQVCQARAPAATSGRHRATAPRSSPPPAYLPGRPPAPPPRRPPISPHPPSPLTVHTASAMRRCAGYRPLPRDTRLAPWAGYPRQGLSSVVSRDLHFECSSLFSHVPLYPHALQCEAPLPAIDAPRPHSVA